MAEALHPSRIEHEIGALAARAGFHLRADKVALRVLGLLKSDLVNVVPVGQAVLITITAPIKQPGKTAAALGNLVRSSPSGEEIKGSFFGNEIQVRWLSGIPIQTPNVIGFVHNPHSDPDLLLNLAERRLHLTI